MAYPALGRQGNKKGATPTRDRLHPDPPPLPLQNFLSNRQAQPFPITLSFAVPLSLPLVLAEPLGEPKVG